jgi:hypothetical protein
LAALTQAYEAFERPGLVVSYKLTTAKIYKGALIGAVGTGYAGSMNHATANMKFLGVANETIDNVSGLPGDKSVNVTKSGSFVFKAASGFTPSIADIGKEVYANTDWEVQVATTGLTNLYKVGTIVALETTATGSAGVRVRIDNHTV